MSRDQYYLLAITSMLIYLIMELNVNREVTEFEKWTRHTLNFKEYIVIFGDIRV